VKVKFHWDREGSSDDKSSCWIRVAQPQTGGSVLIPRVGWEVIVEFIEGDPDRPIITGHVYNGEAVPPYPLPGNKTVTSIQTPTSPGGGSVNEIRFEDADGSMEFFMNASKDMNVVVANNETWLVEVDDTTHVKGTQKLTVDGDENDV